MVGAIAFVIAMSLENPRSDERFGDISVFVVDAAIDVAEPSAVDAKRPVAAEVLALLHERKWIAAGLRARDLEETGMSRAQIAELLAHEAPQAARLVEARIQELVDGDDCVTAINEAMQFERGWDTVARRAILIARGCEIESAADSDVYETVLAASEAGHVKLALETCQKQKRMPREVRIVCALAACVAKAPRLQKQWQAQLDAPDLARVTEYCGARRAAD